MEVCGRLYPQKRSRLLCARYRASLGISMHRKISWRCPRKRWTWIYVRQVEASGWLYPRKRSRLLWASSFGGRLHRRLRCHGRQFPCFLKTRLRLGGIRLRIASWRKCQMKYQLDATLCRFYFCRVTLHFSGVKRPSSGIFKTSKAATGTCVIVAGKSSHLLIRAGRPDNSKVLVLYLWFTFRISEYHLQISPTYVTYKYHLKKSPKNITYKHNLQISPTNITYDYHLHMSPTNITYEYHLQISPTCHL